MRSGEPDLLRALVWLSVTACAMVMRPLRSHGGRVWWAPLAVGGRHTSPCARYPPRAHTTRRATTVGGHACAHGARGRGRAAPTPGDARSSTGTSAAPAHLARHIAAGGQWCATGVAPTYCVGARSRIRGLTCYTLAQVNQQNGFDIHNITLQGL